MIVVSSRASDSSMAVRALASSFVSKNIQLDCIVCPDAIMSFSMVGLPFSLVFLFQDRVNGPVGLSIPRGGEQIYNVRGNLAVYLVAPLVLHRALGLM